MLRFTLIAALALCACTATEQPVDAAELSPASLNGTTWALVGATTEPTPGISFSETSVSGPAGCNRWFSSYTMTPGADAAALRFDAIGATRMACEGPKMATERAFLGALERTRQARRDGDALVLLDEAGAETARFIAAEL